MNKCVERVLDEKAPGAEFDSDGQGANIGFQLFQPTCREFSYVSILFECSLSAKHLYADCTPSVSHGRVLCGLFSLACCATMEHCPVELLHVIASYACTDGGRTGSSLSLVSRHIRTATSQARFQSVVLNSRANIHTFADIARRPDLHLGIRTLFVATFRDVQLSGDSSLATTEGGASREHADDDKEQALKETILVILRVTAPTLVNLFLDVPSYTFCIGGDALGLEYPRLINLSIPTLKLPRDTESLTPIFPALKHLHVSSSHDIWEVFAKCAPALESILRPTPLTYIARKHLFLRRAGLGASTSSEELFAQWAGMVMC